MADRGDIVRAFFRAYEDSDRNSIEALIADDFSFTSPLDNQLSRDAYFKRCWPNHEHCRAFKLIRVEPVGETVFIIYELTHTRAGRFRNCELLTIRDGKVASAEVYFGWNLPHAAEPGGFTEREGALA